MDPKPSTLGIGGCLGDGGSTGNPIQRRALVGNMVDHVMFGLSTEMFRA